MLLVLVLGHYYYYYYYCGTAATAEGPLTWVNVARTSIAARRVSPADCYASL